MKDYENVYSDVSYTLSEPKAMDIIRDKFRQPGMTDINGVQLIDKLMYGTDFYLTQQEELGDEPSMQNIFSTEFNAEEITKLAYDNPDKFLASKIHGG